MSNKNNKQKEKKYITKKDFRDALRVIINYKKQIGENPNIDEDELRLIPKHIGYNRNTLLYNTECSQRLLNILYQYKDDFNINISRETRLKDLGDLSLSEFSNKRNAGKKTINELRDLCLYSGVKLAD